MILSRKNSARGVIPDLKAYYSHNNKVNMVLTQK